MKRSTVIALGATGGALVPAVLLSPLLGFDGVALTDYLGMLAAVSPLWALAAGVTAHRFAIGSDSVLP